MPVCNFKGVWHIQLASMTNLLNTSRACGGHGYSMFSGLGHFYQDYLPKVTVSGESLHEMYAHNRFIKHLLYYFVTVGGRQLSFDTADCSISCQNFPSCRRWQR